MKGEFQLTPRASGENVYLLLFPHRRGLGRRISPSDRYLMSLLQMAFAISSWRALGVFAALRSLIPFETVVPLLVGAGAAGLIVLSAWVRETVTRTAA